MNERTSVVEWISVQDRLPVVTQGWTRDNLLYCIDSVVYAGHYHRNGCFYSYRNGDPVGRIEQIDKYGMPLVEFWAYYPCGVSMIRQFIDDVGEYAKLYRDPQTGIAWIEDGATGLEHSAHPSIDTTGSVKGMIARGYWREDDCIVESHGYLYNISHRVVSSEYDEIARQHCQCGGNHASS